MKAKHQRLSLALIALVAIIGAGLLAMSALKDQAAYFYTPSDAARDHVRPGVAVRLGGMVQKGSIRREADGVTIRFVVTDGAEAVPVRFKGIVPDLFKEDSGVVAEGRFEPGGGFVADNILAKHDERYMPPQMAGEMHRSESLKK
ncbi:cytochrome c maturation protein CcmE [Sphingomonas oleivorans]|uniref:Cytochrome c-type biogenesis protein CcmE n=1 Tax=Sphingomonas oleivorans TaxID=1735121 RepID=A0A2T5FWG8_9SPHN|nr:cytochrome c maturation protein CcmE [Sphingomonas oleivorans]PTQ10124.1 cytochrome c maturation protein CcmE [Sphingomonas oleivorans]